MTNGQEDPSGVEGMLMRSAARFRPLDHVEAGAAARRILPRLPACRRRARRLGIARVALVTGSLAAVPGLMQLASLVDGAAWWHVWLAQVVLGCGVAPLFLHQFGYLGKEG